MGYDCDDSFPFDFKPNGISFSLNSKGKLSPRETEWNFKPNGIPFGSKSKGKLSSQSYPIQFERKWNTSFLIEECDAHTVRHS